MYVVTPAGLNYVAEKPVPYGKKSESKKIKKESTKVSAGESGKSSSAYLGDSRKIGRYIDPKSDFGFKRFFGRENEPDLRDFLNALLEGYQEVGKLIYTDQEINGEVYADRTVVFDLMVKDAALQHFLIESQVKYQEFFVNRIVFYLTKYVSSL